MSSGTGRTAAIVGFSLVGGVIGGAIGGSMGFGLGYMAGSFLGQMIFPAKTPKSAMPKINNYPVQSAAKGPPVPLEYGTCRMAGNIVWLGPLNHYVVKEGGGKGGGGGGETKTIYYYRSFLISICEGERHILKMWAGKHQIDLGPGVAGSGTIVEISGTPKARTARGVAEQDVTIFYGDGINSGLVDLVGEDYANYTNLCCAFFRNYELGLGDTIPAFVFEVSEDVPLGLIASPGYQMDANYEITAKLGDTFGCRSVDYNAARAIVALQSHPYYSPGEPIYIFDADGTPHDIHFEVPPVGWPTSDINGGIRFSPDGESIYAYISYPFADPWLFRWNARTGALMDSKAVTDSGLPSACLQTDPLGNIYFLGAGTAYPAYRLTRLEPDLQLGDTGTWQAVGTIVQDIGIHMIGTYTDPNTGAIWPVGDGCVCGGTYDSPTGTYIQAKLFDLQTLAVTAGISLGGSLAQAWRAEYVGGYWFVLASYTTSDHHIYQIAPSGAVVNSIAVPEAEFKYDIFRAPGGRLGLTYRDAATGGPAVNVYDSSLNLLSTYYCWNSDFPQASIHGLAGPESVYVHVGDGRDANPADIIYDLLTHTRRGAGMPVSHIDSASFEEIRVYCAENDFLISLSIDQSKPVLDWIQYVCSHFSGFLYWIGGKLYLGAWKDDAPEFALTRDDLVRDGDEPPVQVRKRKYSETFNRVEVAYESREDNYGGAVAVDKDEVDWRYSGKLRKAQIELVGVKRAVLAQKLATRYLIDSMYRFGIYMFRLGYKHALLHVGQVGWLSDGFKIDHQRIRITSISEAKDGKNLEIEAVDDIADLYPDLQRQTQTTLRVPETEVVASDLTEPIITTREDWHDPILHISLAPQDANCDGWYIYISRDGNTYDYLKRVTISGVTGGDANSAGTTLTALKSAKAPTWRRDESFQVSIGTVTDLATDITDREFFDGERLAKIGSEVIAYRTCEESGTPGIWTITTIIRGLHQTEPVAHVAGEAFRTLDVNHDWTFNESDIGRTIYIKACTFYAGAAQSLADVTATEVTIMGNYRRPYGAALVRLASDENDGGLDGYSGETVDVHWNLCGKTAGFNIGSFDSSGTTWKYGDSEALLVPHGGVPWGTYQTDPQIQGVDLVCKDEAGTLIGQRSLGIVSTATITKATDLGGNNPAEIEVMPRYSLRATREESIMVDDNT